MRFTIYFMCLDFFWAFFVKLGIKWCLHRWRLCFGTFDGSCVNKKPWGCVSHYITHKLLLPLWVGVEIKECSKDLWTSSQSHVSLLFSSQNILKWQEIVLFYLITIILYLKMDQTTSCELNMCLCKSALFKGKFIST